MDTSPRFVVTPWRHSQELIQLRRDFYKLGDDNVDRRQAAVNKVLAWRTRKESLPLLLDSTADVVDVVLRDEEGGLGHNGVRLLYATAISRFITGLLDTQIDLIRSRPSWFPPGRTLQLPTPLLEVRHCIVHRHMPSLGELKRAAQQALDWLWEWYWAHLEAAFRIPLPSAQESDGAGDEDGVRSKMEGILRTYVKARKNEIKTRRKRELCMAAHDAHSTYILRFTPMNTTVPSAATQTVLLRLLVEEKMILPADKKLGSTMSGAFLIWTPLLLCFCTSSPVFFTSLLGAVRNRMNSTNAVLGEEEKEGMCEWARYMLCSSEWSAARGEEERTLREKVLGDCFSSPTRWNLRVAEGVVDVMGEEGEMWKMVLEASRSEAGDSVVDVGMDVEEESVVREAEDGDVQRVVDGGPVETVTSSPVQDKVKGPQKFVGLWKPKPIGWLPEGWDEDA